MRKYLLGTMPRAQKISQALVHSLVRGHTHTCFLNTMSRIIITSERWVVSNTLEALWFILMTISFWSVSLVFTDFSLSKTIKSIILTAETKNAVKKASSSVTSCCAAQDFSGRQQCVSGGHSLA